MPTVISLLNSYARTFGLLHGFVLKQLLIVAGSPRWSFQLYLSVNHVEAMNRSFSMFCWGLWAGTEAAPGRWRRRNVPQRHSEEAASILSAANKVVIVPGYDGGGAGSTQSARTL